MRLHLPGNMAGDVPDCHLQFGLVFFSWWLWGKWLVLQGDAQCFGSGSAFECLPSTFHLRLSRHFS